MHSAADIITNSSSELFVCNTSQTIDNIRTMIQTMASDINCKDGVGEIKLHHGLDGFKEILKNLQYCVEQNEILELIYKFVPADRMKNLELPDLHILSYNDRPVDLTFDYFCDLMDNSRINAVEKSIQFLQENNLEDCFGMITTIESEYDNSIPYDLFDSIESSFNAVRYHLG